MSDWKTRLNNMTDKVASKTQFKNELPTWHVWKNATEDKPEQFRFEVLGAKKAVTGNLTGQFYIWGTITYAHLDELPVSECMSVPQKMRTCLFGKESTNDDLPKLVGKTLLVKNFGYAQQKDENGKPFGRRFFNVIAEVE